MLETAAQSMWGHALWTGLRSNAPCCCSHYLNELSNYSKYSRAIWLYLYELIKLKMEFGGGHCFYLFWNSKSTALNSLPVHTQKAEMKSKHCFMATIWPWDSSRPMRSCWGGGGRTVTVRALTEDMLLMISWLCAWKRTVRQMEGHKQGGLEIEAGQERWN